MTKITRVLALSTAIALVAIAMPATANAEATCISQPGMNRDKCIALASMGLDVLAPLPGGAKYKDYEVTAKLDQAPSKASCATPRKVGPAVKKNGQTFQTWACDRSAQ